MRRRSKQIEQHFLKDKVKKELFLLLVYDSVHYYGGSAFGGNRFRLDTSALCRQLQKEYLNTLHMHWSLKTNTTAVPFPIQLINAKYQVEMSHNYNEVSGLFFISRASYIPNWISR